MMSLFPPRAGWAFHFFPTKKTNSKKGAGDAARLKFSFSAS